MSGITGTIRLTLAHSPDPDDVFMWWPITGMMDPKDAGRVVSGPELETGRFAFRGLAADIAELNRRAIGAGDFEITALSMFTYAHVQDRYVLTSCGSSVGVAYGPKLVMRSPARGDPAGRGEWISDEDRAALEGGVIAVPGVKTTAFACLCMLMGWKSEEDWRGRIEEMPFDRILEAAAIGTHPGCSARIVGGVLIHQSQLTFGSLGLREVVDFGEYWRERTGLPLPLGGNAIRRDLEERFGAGTIQEITEVLHRSIVYSLKHRARSIEYAMGYAPEITREQAERYIDMYVNEYTVSLGKEGERGVERLIGEASRLGLCPGLDERRRHIFWPGML